MSWIDSEDLLERVKDYSPVTPPAVMEEFLKGSIHQDFKNEIIARIEQMRDFNEDCDSKKYLETRGGIKVLRLIMNIFTDLHQNMIADLESTDKETDDESNAEQIV